MSWAIEKRPNGWVVVDEDGNVRVKNNTKALVIDDLLWLGGRMENLVDNNFLNSEIDHLSQELDYQRRQLKECQESAGAQYDDLKRTRDALARRCEPAALWSAGGATQEEQHAAAIVRKCWPKLAESLDELGEPA